MRFRRAFDWTPLPCVLLLGALGCSSDAPPERHRNGSAEVDESDIRAALIGGDVELLVPVRRLSDDVLEGSLRVALLDVSAGEPERLGGTSLSFTQDEATHRHRLLIQGVADGLERVDAAPLVLDWTLEGPGADLYGRRSLFAALGNLDVQVRGPSELSSGATSPLRVIVRDPQTGRAVAGADVAAAWTTTSETGEEQETPLFEGLTDARGELVELLSLPADIRDGTIRVTVVHDGAQVWTSHRISRRADDQLYLGTDKTLYKPGQDVHLRLLALEGPDRQPVSAREVLFEAKDGRGNKVFKRRTRTDSFGVAAMVVPTDTRVNEGRWAFSAEVDGRRTEIEVPVERYVLPKMRIDVSADRAFALPGETIRGDVHAAYLFGEPVTGASVTVRAQTATGIPVGTLTGTTGPDGSYGFVLSVPESVRTAALEDQGDTLVIQAEVIDTAAQVEHGEARLALAAAPLGVHLVLDSGTIAPGIENLAYVIVTDPLGRPVRAAVTIDGVEAGPLETDASGVAELRFVPMSETIELDVRAADGAGRSHGRTFTLEGSDAAPLRLRTDRAMYAPGETARFHVFSARGADRVYLDIYRGASGVSSTEVDLTGGSAEIEIPITAEMGGLLVVDALALGAEGQTFRASRPLLVERDDGLRVSVATAEESYRPGEDATLEVTVADSSGAPQVASVGLTVVDEAVFALGGEPQTTLLGSFGLDASALSDSASVAGHSLDDLLGVEDSASRERLARILFASAGDVTAPNFEYSSLATELPQVVDRLAGKVRYDAEQLLAELEPAARQGWLTPDTVQSASSHWRETDPFGRPYHISVESTDGESHTLVLLSDGPDELAETRDDVTARVPMDRLFYDGRSTGGGGGEPAPGADFDTAERAGNAAPPQEAAAEGASDDSGGATVRSDFRETALVRPTLITDGSGRAQVSFPLPHSITTWRVTADGSTAHGKIGSVRERFRTFQSFFVDFSMPTSVRAGDVLELPAVVYNYLDEPASVTVSIDSAEWFDLGSAATQVVSLGPSEVRAVRFRMEVTQAGEHSLTIRGTGDGIADALVRQVSVEPDGHPEDETVSGTLNGSRLHTLSIPTDTVEGGALVELALTPGFAAEAVQGLEGMVREPNGCFEQTTSTAWPNTLVAAYLEQTGQMTPELREEVLGVVTRGYQRLLTFESPTGGFNWWGDEEPGNRILSAIFLWHLEDLESLIEIDSAVRDRTLEWLVQQQNPDGSWDSGDALHAGNEVLGTSEARTTAFIAWALAHTGWADDAVERASGWLRTNVPTEDDLYANALVANALVLADPGGSVTADVLGRLDRMKVDLDEGGILWPTETPSWTGAGGDAASVETTGLVAYGLMQAEAYPSDVAGAMQFIVANKDSVGTWYNTQATMNALRALSAAASPNGSDAEGTLTVRVNDVLAHTIDVTPDNGDVYRTFDLTELAGPGPNTIELEMVGTGEVSYRLTRRAYRPEMPLPEGPFDLTVSYDHTEAVVGTPIHCTARAHNGDTEMRNQVMVRVGRAPGFTPRVEDLEALVASGVASRYEIREDDVTFYLMEMAPGESRELRFRLTPSLEVDATAPASSIYAYYEPTLRTVAGPQRFVVTAP